MSKTKKEHTDPLVVCVMDYYVIEDIPIHVEMQNTQVLLTPQLWILLIAKDNVVTEDLWTTRNMDGAYIMLLRQRFIESFPRIFGENRDLVLREELVGLFRVIAQQYIAAGAQKTKNAADAATAAHALIHGCNFAVRRAEELCMRVEETVIEGARGAKAAQMYRSGIMDLNPNNFSLRGQNLVAKLQKLPDGGAGRGGGPGTPRDPPRDNPRKKGKRKCMRCKAGPFNHQEFAAHNKTCK